MSSAPAVVLTQETLGYEPTGWDYDHENDTSAPEQLGVELFKHHGYEHKDISQLISIPISNEEIEAAAKRDYVNWRLEEAKQHPKNKDGLGFEYVDVADTEGRTFVATLHFDRLGVKVNFLRAVSKQYRRLYVGSIPNMKGKA